MTEDKKPAEPGQQNGADPSEPPKPAGDAAPSAPAAADANPAPTASETQDAPAAAGGTESEILKLEAEIADLRDRSLRALADAENTRRRAEREISDTRKYAASAFAKDLLNVSDNLKRALEAVPAELRERDEHLKALVVGVEMVEKDLLTAFEKHGIKRIEPLNEPFNHDFHQAMYEVTDSGKPAGTVVELLQPGYVMHDRLLRPAMVAVAKGDPNSPPDDLERVDTTA